MPSALGLRPHDRHTVNAGTTRGLLAVLGWVALPIGAWASPDRGAILPGAATLALALVLCGWLARRGVHAAPPALDPVLTGWLLLGATVSLWPIGAGTRAMLLVGVVPVATLVAWSSIGVPMSRATRTGRWLIALWVVGSVLALGSRAGYLGLSVAIATFVVSRVESPRLRRRRAGMVVIGATAAAATLVATSLGSWALLDASPQGFSWRVALHGRSTIWQRALSMLTDQPLTGIGLGAHHPVQACCYRLPFAGGAVDHAHDQLLQTTLELGPIGGLALLGLFLRAVLIKGRALTTAPSSEVRDLESALFAGLLGVACVGLTEAIPLGSTAAVLPACLLGWCLAPGAGSGRSPSSSETAATHPGGRWLLAVALPVAALVLARAPFEANLAANRAIRALVREPETITAAEHRLEPLVSRHGHLGWLHGLLLGQRDQSRRDTAWLALTRHDPAYVSLLAAHAPLDRELAAAITNAQPNHAAAHRWLAASQGPSPRGVAREVAIAALRRTTALEPRDGPAWLRLGDLLTEQTPDRALDAFEQACRHGDPGANGCVRAANLAIRLGARERAIELLRRSRWPPAHARADALATSKPDPSP